MKFIFSVQNVESFMQLLEMEKRIEKIFLVMVIKAFESLAGSQLYYEENSYDWQLTFYQTALRSQIRPRHVF